MASKNAANVTITDVTLREYGQNVKKEDLDLFTPDIRSEIALNLIDAGFKSIEVFSCVNPQIAPSMDEAHLKKIIKSLCTFKLAIAGSMDSLDEEEYYFLLWIYKSYAKKEWIETVVKKWKDGID